ncbi:MAG: orotate phosphoribosyltransferase [Acidiferrobacter sp.]
MDKTESEFFDLAVRCGALRFGAFTLKSGRASPYFFNAAAFASGRSMMQLGRLYARAVRAQNLAYDMVFGPAYKGIPLALALVMGLALEQDRDVPYSFNRKEAKDHGEGGLIIGPPLKGRVLVIDDVISAGTSVRESAELIAGAGATLAGVVIALDREERGAGTQSAVSEVEAQHHVPVVRLGRLSGLLTYLDQHDTMRHHWQAVADYRAQYGA